MLFTLSLLIFSAPFEAPCKPTHQADAGELQYLACAGGLLFTYKKGDEGPVELRREQLDGEIIGFHNGKGRLWVEIAKSHAIPLGALETGKTSVLQLRAPAVLATAPRAAEQLKNNPLTATPDPPATAATPGLEGRVVGRLPGRVVIDLGTKNGIKRGDSMEVFRRDEVTLAEDAGSITQETTLVVAQVLASSPERAILQLGRNEWVEMGVFARPSNKKISASALLPPRVGDIGVVGFTVRPFFALGNLGGGVLSEVYSRWRGKDHWFAEAQLAPAAFGVGNPGAFATTAMKAVGGYDGPVLAVGIGIGLPVFSWDDAQVGDGLLLIPQYARLGSADGAHLAFEPVFSLGANSIDFFGFTGRLQVPVGGRSWLIATGSGAPMYGYGEIGVRHLIRGNGTQDSLIVTVTTGGGAVFGIVRRNERLESFGIGGPMVGFGMEWRN